MKKMISCAFFLLVALSTAWAAETMLLEKVQGEVQILKKGTSEWVVATDGMTLEAGDKVKTGEKSTVSIKMEKGTVVLAEKTDFGVKEYTAKDEQITTSLELTLGKLKAKVDKLKQGSEFKITTPTSVAAVRGTFFGLWVYEYLGGLFSRLDVWDGNVNFGDRDSDQNFDVKEDQYATGGEDGIKKPEDQDDEEDDFGDGDEPGDPFDAQDGFDQDTQGSQDNEEGNPVEDESNEESDSNNKDEYECRGPKC